MFSGAILPHRNLLGEAFHFLCNPKLSLTSVPFGLKESFGGSVAELGRSRPQHRAKATIGRRRGPPCGKATVGSRRPELAEKNRQKSGAGADTPFGGPGKQSRRAALRRRQASRLAAKPKNIEKDVKPNGTVRFSQGGWVGT